MRLPSVALATLACLALAAPRAAADLGGEPSTLHAIVGARIVTEPGAEPFEGTIVLRDGLVDMIGEGVEIPAGAIVRALPGRTLYPAFVEPYLRVPAPADPEPVPTRETESWMSGTARDGAVPANPNVRTEARAVDALPLDPELARALRGAGYGAALVALDRGVLRGSCAVVSLAEEPVVDALLDPEAGQAIAFAHGTGGPTEYPASLMGAIALVRQTLYDAAGGEPTVAALAPVVRGERRAVFESEDLRMLPRALAVAREHGLRAVVVSGGGDEHRAPDLVARWLREARADLVTTVDYPAAPAWIGDEGRRDVTTAALVAWDRAPGNPAALAAAGVPFAVTTQGLADRGDVRARLAEAIARGLSPDVALAALTTEPARMLGLGDRLGTLEAGRMANLLVATGDLFAPGTRIEEMWIEGVRHGDEPTRAGPEDLAGRWALTIGAGEDTLGAVVVLESEAGGVSGTGPDSTALDAPALRRGRLTFGLPLPGGSVRVTLARDGAFLAGEAVRPDGPVPVLARRLPKKDPAALPTAAVSAGAPRWPPVADRDDPAVAPPAVLVRGATIWTGGPEGTLADADLLVVDGKVREVGRDLSAPRAARILDGAGRHVTPGLVDCHSHSSISGGVNEGTNSCTCEARIADVVDPDSPAIYRELAGGLTVVNLLHGSANVIGAQNAVIKNRWGEPAEAMLLAGAPPGVKFALGENVKQSNWGKAPHTRYPQTRMGVEQLLRERFLAAEEYRRAWTEWRRDRRRGPQPRRDLRLDALLEVLDGERLVHCHAYRADEIVMMMRVADDFGFRVATFQHVLEGYKCADEIAAHGAGASSFSDWWTYKYEVVDAIPYNAEILWRRGVLTSLNSDSSELSRRMNLEAAKAVKYGGLPDDEALKLVTLYPARQLGIDGRVGSLERGKDGDFVIWSDDPLSDRAICLETWIEGVRRFSREDDLARRPAVTAIRDALFAAAEERRDVEDRDPPDPPGEGALGPRWGRSEEEAGRWLARGECRVADDASAGWDR